MRESVWLFIASICSVRVDTTTPKEESKLESIERRERRGFFLLAKSSSSSMKNHSPSSTSSSFTPLVADAASCVYKLRLGLLADNNIRWHTSRRAQKLFIAFPSVESAAASMLLLARLAVATFYFIAVKIGKTRIASVVMPLIYTPTKKRRRRAKTSSPSQDIT